MNLYNVGIKDEKIYSAGCFIIADSERRAREMFISKCGSFYSHVRNYKNKIDVELLSDDLKKEYISDEILIG